MTRDEDLIRMVNQIARAFDLYPEPEAVSGIARHLKDFWDPKMRERIESLKAEGGHGLAARAQQAIAALTAS